MDALKSKPHDNFKYGHSQSYDHRLQQMIYMCCIPTIIIPLVWGSYNAYKMQWSLVAVKIGLILSSIFVFILNKRGHIHTASVVLCAAVFIVFCIFCTFYGTPDATHQRSQHFYFVVLGIGSLMIYKKEHYLIAFPFAVLCFATYCFFASSMWGIEPPYPMSPFEKTVSVWVNNIVGCIMLFMIFYIMYFEKENDIKISHLRKAMSNREIELYYQPQSGESGAIVGAEALLRWHHPSKGDISPIDFISLAEDSGIMPQLGHWIIRQACSQLVTWAKQPETSALTLSINVSAQEFKEVGYVDELISVIERAGANPTRLKLELTESLLVNDIDDIIQKMTLLNEYGIKICLDDFGTGYSSLSYLNKLPISQIKIDRSFVKDVLSNHQAKAIATAMVNLGQSLNLDLIAEGIETIEQRDFFASIGCTAIQGYLLSRPLKLEAFDLFVLQHNKQHAPLKS